jgi:hypothetical protein
MNAEKKTWILIIVAVVIVILGGIAVSYFHKSATTQILYATKGELVQGFPQNLMLDSDPSVISSYSIVYSKAMTQYTAQWVSSNSMQAEYQDYLSYLQANGWGVINVNVSTSSHSIYAVNTSSSAITVLITPALQMSQVTLTYVTNVPYTPTAMPTPANITVEQGKLPADFPTSLIIDPSATILGSTENPNIISGMKTEGVLYATKETSAALVSGYINLLSTGGWRMVPIGDTNQVSQISATNASSSLSLIVRFQALSNTMSVSLSFTAPLKK